MGYVNKKYCRLNTIKHVSKKLGLGETTIKSRVYEYGWNAMEALETPFVAHKNRSNFLYTYKGERMVDVCKRLNMSYNTVYSRLQRGWTMKQALELPRQTYLLK